MMVEHPPAAPVSVDFAGRCCARFGVATERYLEFALRRTLYPHARLLRPLLRAWDADFFAPDREFLAAVGRLSRWRDFAGEVKDFHCHPANSGFLRRRLRLRVSVGRTRRFFAAAGLGPAP